MVRKLHKSWPGGHFYMLVAVDKFTRWIEVTPVTTQDSMVAVNFIKSTVFRFVVPHNIITDNGTNFTLKEYKDYCEGLGIKLNFASIAHPQTNGQVEKVNGLICRHKEKTVSTTQKSQTHLGRRANLRALEFVNNAKCNNSRNIFLSVPRRRSHASS
jgi:IS30 family transposase